MTLRAAKIFVVALAASSALALADDCLNKAEQEASSAQQPKTLKDLTIEQRAEAVEKAKSALEEMDTRINNLAAGIDRKWDRMDDAARKTAYHAMDTLRKERTEAAEWFGGLKHGGKEAWEEVKTGFLQSYDALRNTYAKADDEL
jgi:predicted RNase H-like nuclease (RuvC/YqgF family)